MQNLLFLEVSITETAAEKIVTIKKLHHTTTLLQYWITQNTFTDMAQLGGIGLGEVIYNKIPPHHNYFGMCWVCTCGDAGCYNYMAWYIRFANSFSVGFIINKYCTIELNAKHSCFDEDDYNEYIAERAATNAHNQRLQQIKAVLAADDTASEYYGLSEADKEILKEGEQSYHFPCVYEKDDFCIY